MKGVGEGNRLKMDMQCTHTHKNGFSVGFSFLCFSSCKLKYSGHTSPVIVQGRNWRFKGGGARIGVQVCVFLDVRKIKKIIEQIGKITLIIIPTQNTVRIWDKKLSIVLCYNNLSYNNAAMNGKRTQIITFPK